MSGHPGNIITANGRPVPATFPCTVEAFLVAQNLLPRSVVVEHNGEAVAGSRGLVFHLSINLRKLTVAPHDAIGKPRDPNPARRSPVAVAS